MVGVRWLGAAIARAERVTRWFGFPHEGRPPAAESLADKVPVPVGVDCFGCRYPFGDVDRGFYLVSGEPFHQGCLLTEVIGPKWRERFPELAAVVPVPSL